jgi:predicted membrane protein
VAGTSVPDPLPSTVSTAPSGGSARGPAAGVEPIPGQARAEAGGFHLGRIVGGLVLVVLGALWLADVTDVLTLRAAIVLPALLVVVGLALVAGSFQGSHPTLVTIGVLLAVATVFSALSPPEALRGGIGSRRYTVTDPTELRSRYQVGLGDLTLDLSDLTLDHDRAVDVDLGAGDLTVIVPAGLAVTVDARAGAGEIVLFGQREDGLSVERHDSHQGDGQAGGAAHHGGELDLDLEVGAGRIEVRR